MAFHSDNRASVGGVTNPIYSEQSVGGETSKIEEENMAYDVAGGLSPLYESLPEQ